MTLRLRAMRRAAIVTLVATAAGVSAAQAEPARYVLDPTHTSIAFSSKHVGFASVLGMFLEVEGAFTYDEATQTLSEATATIQAASVFTNHGKRDEHLRGKDFLNADAHPEISFKLTSATALSENSGEVTGDLTIGGVTKPITMEALLNKADKTPFGGHYVLGVSLRGVIARSDWNITYALQGDAVADDVPVTIEFEAIRQE